MKTFTVILISFFLAAAAYADSRYDLQSSRTVRPGQWESLSPGQKKPKISIDVEKLRLDALVKLLAKQAHQNISISSEFKELPLVTLTYRGNDITEVLDMLSKSVDVWWEVSSGGYVLRKYKTIVIDANRLHVVDFHVTGTEPSMSHSGTIGSNQGSSGQENTPQLEIHGGSQMKGLIMKADRLANFLNISSPLGSDEDLEGIDPNEKIEVNPSGFLMVTARPSKIKKIRKYLATEDRKSKDIKVRIKVARVDLYDQYKFGVDWKVLSDSLISDGIFALAVKQPQNIANGLAMTIGKDDFTGTLQALQMFGNVSVVSELEENSRLGTTTPLERLRKIWYNEGMITWASQNSDQTSSRLAYETEGVRIYVTPIEKRGGDTILANVYAEIASLTSMQTIQINKDITAEVPIIDRNKVNTAIEIPNNGIAILAGLTTETVGDRNEGVPVLSKLPWVGRLFTKTTSDTKRSEFLILLSITDQDIEEDI